MNRKRWSGAFFALFVAAGCGDDDGPKGKCNQLVAGACELMDQCKVLSDVAQCRRDQSRAMECDAAHDVGATYDKCVEDIKARDCATWVTALNQDLALPDSCRTAITK